MTSIKAGLAVFVFGAVAMTFSAAPADARVARQHGIAHHSVRGVHAEHRSHRGSYNYAPATGGSYFVEPNGPSNYNRNQS